jgi:transcriptional regulator of acetoin/glycerol metabolism
LKSKDEDRTRATGAEEAGNTGAHGVIPWAELEKRAILAAVQEAGGDKLLAARLLKIGKTTLYRKLKEYGL